MKIFAKIYKQANLPRYEFLQDIYKNKMNKDDWLILANGNLLFKLFRTFSDLEKYVFVFVFQVKTK